MGEISPRELKTRLDSGAAVRLLDVREAWELQIAALDGATHIPMNQVPGRIEELDKDGEIVVFCHHGGRSGQVVAFLKQSGFEHVLNLTGGIDAWSRDVDAEVPEY